MSTKRMLLTVLAAGTVVLALVLGSQLAGMIVPIALADEGVWGPQVTNPSFMYRLGPEVRVSTPSTPQDAPRRLPAVAYNWNRRQYLVVWHNQWPGNRDIYAQRVSDTGQLAGSWFCITTGTGDRAQPAVAYNGTNDEYLIVWMKEVSPDTYEIWGRIIAWNAGYMHPEFKIISWPDRSFWTPRVAWNSYRNEYLVVWNAFDTSGGLPGVPRDIAGARISENGSIPAINSLTTYAGPHQVDITYNVAKNEYFLAFVVIHTQATTGNDIYGLRVNGDTGTSVYPPGLLHICTTAKDQNTPAVATNGQDRYMVVWEHPYSSTDRDIYKQELDADGNLVGVNWVVTYTSLDETVPDIAAKWPSTEWIVVWQKALTGGTGYGIRAVRWISGFTMGTYAFDVADWVFYECQNPAVTAGHAGYFIAYEELPPSALADSTSLTAYQHIYGQMWWPEAAYLPLILKNK